MMTSGGETSKDPGVTSKEAAMAPTLQLDTPKAKEAPTLPMDIPEEVDRAPTLQLENTNRAFDRRIEDELDTINKAIAEINRLSGLLFKSRVAFRDAFNSAKQRLEKMYKTNKKAIEKSRPFFRMRLEAYMAKEHLVQSAALYRSCCLDLDEAKTQETEAERALTSQMSSSASGCGGTQDPEVLINLNKATQQVLDVSQQKQQAALEQERRMVALSDMDHQLALMGQEMGPAIEKSWSYFQLRGKYQNDLDKLLLEVRERQQTLQEVKQKYRSAFANLDVISAELEQRQRAMGFQFADTNLSKFEEIEDMAEALDAVPMDRAQSMESMYSTDSIISTTSSAHDDLHAAGMANLTRSISLDEIAHKEVLESHDDASPASILNNYAVTFEMKL